MAFRPIRLLGPALIMAGIATVVLAVAEHQATLYLVLFVPVVTGASALLALGIVLLLAGLLALPMTLLAGSATYEEAPRSGPREAPGNEMAPRSGGLVLVGPVPFFFGAWQRPPRWIYWLAVLFGALFLVGLVLAGLIFF
jgi:uncharacterized membrane protein